MACNCRKQKSSSKAIIKNPSTNSSTNIQRRSSNLNNGRRIITRTIK